MSTDIHILLKKLDTFISKYYRTQLLKGCILFVIGAIIYFSSIFFVEYVSFLSPNTRTIIFYSSIILSLIGLWHYIVVPLFHILRIGKTLSYEEASHIISTHFPEIKDSLLNTLQLSNEHSNTDNALAIAAINQKIAKLKPIPFTSAIDYKTISKYIRIFGIAIASFIIIYILFPEVFFQGAKRIIHYTNVYEKPAPFTFHLKNTSTTITKGEDFTAYISIQGDYVPQRVYFVVGNTSFYMQQTSKTNFEYTVKNCNNSFSFYCEADKYTSQNFTVLVEPVPQIIEFTITAEPPKYTHIENFTTKNVADITVPIGTKLQWNIRTNHTDSLWLTNYIDSTRLYAQNKKMYFSINQLATKTNQYTIQGKNSYFNSYDIIQHTSTVIPDLYPTIQTNYQKDSLHYFTYYFKGKISDDYGFTQLNFTWFNTKYPENITSIPISISEHVPMQEFYYMHTFTDILEEDSIIYYFEVFDNDQFHGPKSSKTSHSLFAIPTQKEKQIHQEYMSNEISKAMDKGMEISQEIIDEIEQTRIKLLNQNLSDWERTQLLEDFKQKQQALQQTLQEANTLFEQKTRMQEQLSPEQQAIVEKQKQIQELLENLIDDELQKLFDEFNALMENFKRDDFFKLTDDMKLSMEELSKQLDRDLELLKRAEIEQKIESTAQNLKELAKQQEEIREEFNSGNLSKEEAQNAQKKTQESLKDIKDSYKNTQEKNEELNHAFSLPEFQEEFNEIENTIENSKEQLNKNQKNKASQEMKKSSEKMDALAQNMQQMMQEQASAQQMEDISNLRKIIDNLLDFSFAQENLIQETNVLSFIDPKYASVASKQNGLKDNYNTIKDSVYALSLRIPQISTPINKDMFEIHKHLNYSVHYLEQRQRSAAMVSQRYTMSSANNVILLLSEVLSAMQEASNQEGGGESSCDKQCKSSSQSGKGKPSFKNMQQIQQSLKQQMERMLQEMEGGQMPKGEGAKQLSEMLAQQEMMKQMMNSLIKNGELSPEGVKELQEIKKLIDKVEQDIVLQNVSQQTLFRQQQILTRMLESEKAENERDKDERREGTESLDNFSQQKQTFETEINKKSQFQDALEQTNMQLKTYYKKIFSQYLLKINEN